MATWRDVTVLDKCVKKLKKAIHRGCNKPCCYHAYCRKTTIDRNCLTQLEHEQLLSTPKGYIFVGDVQRRAELKKCTKNNAKTRLDTGDMWPTVTSMSKQYTIASLCNYFNSLVIQCNSPAWRQEFLNTVMNSVLETIIRDINQVNTSETTSIILKILDSITNSKTTMSSPKDTLQEVQVYLSSALAPWLEKPIENICVDGKKINGRAPNKKDGEIKNLAKDTTNQKSLASNLVSKTGGLRKPLSMGKTKNVKVASRNEMNSDLNFSTLREQKSTDKTKTFHKSNKSVVSRGSKLGSSNQDPTKIKGSIYRKEITATSDKNLNINQKTETKAGRADKSGKGDAGIGGKGGARAVSKSDKGRVDTIEKSNLGVAGRKNGTKTDADGKGGRIGIGERDGKTGADKKSGTTGVEGGEKSGKGVDSRKGGKAGANGKGGKSGVDGKSGTSGVNGGVKNGRDAEEEKSGTTGANGKNDNAGLVEKSVTGAAGGKYSKSEDNGRNGTNTTSGKSGKGGSRGKGRKSRVDKKSNTGVDGGKDGKARADEKSGKNAAGDKSNNAEVDGKSSTGVDGGRGGKAGVDGKSGTSGVDGGEKNGKDVDEEKGGKVGANRKSGKAGADGKSGIDAAGRKDRKAGTNGKSGRDSAGKKNGSAGVGTGADGKIDATGVGTGGTNNNTEHETTYPGIYSSERDKQDEITIKDLNQRPEDQDGKQELDKTENDAKHDDGRLALEVEHEFQATLTELLAECIRKRQTRKTRSQLSKKCVTVADKTKIKTTCPGINIKDLHLRRQTELKVRTWLQKTNEDDDSLCSTPCSLDYEFYGNENAPLCENIRCFAFKTDSPSGLVIKPGNNCGVPKSEVKEGYMLRLDKQIQEMEKAFKLRNRQFLKILKKGAY